VGAPLFAQFAKGGFSPYYPFAENAKGWGRAGPALVFA
jgi:hypothetical protein